MWTIEKKAWRQEFRFQQKGFNEEKGSTCWGKKATKSRGYPKTKDKNLTRQTEGDKKKSDYHFERKERKRSKKKKIPNVHYPEGKATLSI